MIISVVVDTDILDIISYETKNFFKGYILKAPEIKKMLHSLLCIHYPEPYWHCIHFTE